MTKAKIRVQADNNKLTKSTIVRRSISIGELESVILGFGISEVTTRSEASTNGVRSVKQTMELIA